MPKPNVSILNHGAKRDLHPTDIAAVGKAHTRSSNISNFSFTTFFFLYFHYMRIDQRFISICIILSFLFIFTYATFLFLYIILSSFFTFSSFYALLCYYHNFFSCHFINKTIRDRFRRKTREQQIQSHTLSIMLTTTSPTDDRQMLLLLQSYGQRGTPNAFACASNLHINANTVQTKNTHFLFCFITTIVVAYGNFANNHQRPAN